MDFCTLYKLCLWSRKWNMMKHQINYKETFDNIQILWNGWCVLCKDFIIFFVLFLPWKNLLRKQRFKMYAVEKKIEILNFWFPLDIEDSDWVWWMIWMFCVSTVCFATTTRDMWLKRNWRNRIFNLLKCFICNCLYHIGYWWLCRKYLEFVFRLSTNFQTLNSHSLYILSCLSILSFLWIIKQE